MDNPFLDRLIKEKTHDVVHSSSFARAQNGGGIGATSSQSFEQRRVADSNRTNIGRYGDSKLITDSLAQKSKINASTPVEKNDVSLKSRLNSGAQGNNVRGVARQSGNAGSANVAKPITPPARKNPGIFR